MNLYELRHCDFEFFEEHFLDDLYENYGFLTNDKEGHAKDFHCNQTDMDLLLRSIKEGKDSVSSFVSEEEMINGIQDILDRNISDVFDWLQNYRKDYANKRDYEMLELNMNLGGKDPVAYGFKVTDGEYDKYSTTGIRVILERDLSERSPYGFFVKTAYGDLTIGHKTNEIFTGKWLADHLQNKLTPLEQIQLYVKDTYPQFNCTTTYKNNERVVNIWDERNAAYVHEYGVNQKITNPSKEVEKIFDDITHQYNKYRQHENIKEPKDKEICGFEER